MTRLLRALNEITIPATPALNNLAYTRGRYVGRNSSSQMVSFREPRNAVDMWREYSEADPKGRQLLLSLLTAQQKKTLDEEGFFWVTGSKKGLYKIRCMGTTLNVIRHHRRTGNPMYCLCAGPADVTCNDFWLAQKLMIEADEKQFLRIANRDQ